jgi:hypothetical protein
MDDDGDGSCDNDGKRDEEGDEDDDDDDDNGDDEVAVVVGCCDVADGTGMLALSASSHLSS